MTDSKYDSNELPSKLRMTFLTFLPSIVLIIAISYPASYVILRIAGVVQIQDYGQNKANPNGRSRVYTGTGEGLLSDTVTFIFSPLKWAERKMIAPTAWE